MISVIRLDYPHLYLRGVPLHDWKRIMAEYLPSGIPHAISKSDDFGFDAHRGQPVRHFR
jgi:hypothetical protein